MNQILFTIFYFLFIFAGPVLASVNLSLFPIDGTNEIKLKQGFSGLNIPKNIRVRVTSSNANRYQVFQRVLEPLVNEKGDTTDLFQLKTATESNSNTSGTLYLNSPESLSMGDQLLYTSGQNGDSDSFIVSYSITADKVQGNGNFSSKIVYIVRSLNDASYDQQMLGLTLETQSEWRVDVKGLKSADRVSLKDSDNNPQLSDGIKISFSGGTGSDIRIYQETIVIPQNQQSREMTAGILRFLVSSHDQSISGSKGQGILLEKSKDQIYAGRVTQGDLIVTFIPIAENIGSIDAGDYKGQLKYTVESSQGRHEFFINLELQVQPVFTMEAVMPAEGVSFNDVLETKPPQDREIIVTVKTNLHKQYQVTQALMAPLINEKGKEIDKNHLLIRVDIPAGQKGKSRFVDFSPMEVGEYPIFVSDSQGSPVQFKVNYRLEGYSKMNTGNFLAPIRFSLDQN